MKHIVTRECSTTPIKESAFSESDAVDQAWLESRKIDITAGKKLFLFDTFLAINNLENAGIVSTLYISLRLSIFIRYTV